MFHISAGKNGKSFNFFYQNQIRMRSTLGIHTSSEKEQKKVCYGEIQEHENTDEDLK